MKIAKLVETIHDTNPDLLEGIPQSRAVALIEKVFRHIAQSVAISEREKVSYEGLGQFAIRQVQKEIDGKTVTRAHIRFTRARPSEMKNRRARLRARGGAPG